MTQSIVQFALLVDDYDEAIAFFVERLGFVLAEDTDLGEGKRWVRVRPGQGGTELLLARAVTEQQRAAVGNQAGGRVLVFLETDDFRRDFEMLTSRGVVFRGPARDEPYGTVAVFEDLYGNLWDLIQPRRTAESRIEPGKPGH